MKKKTFKNIGFILLGLIIITIIFIASFFTTSYGPSTQAMANLKIITKFDKRFLNYIL